jgi:hypothetical protein
MPTIIRDVDLSVVGANGGGWVTDLGVTAPAVPATYDAAPVASLLPLGAISEDGLGYGFDETNQEFIAWGQLTPYRTQITKSLRTFEVTLWETNRAVCKSAMFRLPVATVAADVSGDYSFSELSSPAPDRRAWLFDVIDGTTIERFYVPVGEVTQRENVSFKNSEVSGYKLSVTAYADATGVTVYHLGHIATPAS